MFQKPDKSFVKELMRIVFSMGEYKELFPVEESKESSCPIIRSFLLQFLLEIRYNYPKPIGLVVKMYFSQPRSSKGPYSEIP